MTAYFKIGDEIWCGNALDYTHLPDAEIYAFLYKGKVINADLSCVFAQSPGGDIITDSNHYNYRSKNEAIDGLIRQLQGLKDDY